MPDFLTQLAGSAAGPDSALQAILNAVPEGILVLSAERHVLFANAAARTLLRAVHPANPSSVLELRDMFHFVDPSTDRIVPTEDLPVARAFRGESVEFQEYLIRRKHTAETRWVELGAQPVTDAAGAVTAVVVTVRGINDRKKREVALEEAGKLSEKVGHRV
ncbi:MAG: PAS domain-containing protein, partial [Acidobacteriota bacterium]